jgi:hypothetical protein
VTRMPRGALYYPYINIEDIDWLKGSLLLFDSVSRMLPPGYPAGFNEGFPLTDYQDAGLLRQAYLFSDRSRAAQDVLTVKFLASAQNPVFLQRYGREAAEALLSGSHPYGFQIHSDRSTFPLRDTLLSIGLAWEPGVYEPWDEGRRYIQMHPRVGQVVMSTIAVASAQSEGLDIVGDTRSGPLHRVLLEQDLDSIYDAWLGDSMPAAPSSASEEQVFEFIIASAADVSGLTPDALRALDREPLADLLKAIKQTAGEIPAMDPGPLRTERFVDATSRILADWQTDRRNLSPFWKSYFGGAGSEATAFMEKGADGVTAAIGAASGSMTLGLIPGYFEQGLFAAGGSFIVGLATTAILTRRRLRDKMVNRPHRYLTLLEGKGVTFRSAETVTTLPNTASISLLEQALVRV